MYFLLVRRRDKGVAIPSKTVSKAQPMRADVHIGIHHSEVLGRVATQAWVFNHTPGPDLIPRLHDATVTTMAQGGINISGIEQVDGVMYAQSWWCRAE